MARANRLGGQGGIFHVTHRRHNREFLLRFALDRDGYLWRCLCYIELNMVRCGRVAHPREWDWLGYHEIMGQRQRYRVLDLDRLCWRLQADNPAEVGNNLEAALADQLAQEQLKREPCWTEGLAVGSAGFVERIQPLILSRQETELVQADREIWVLKEAPVPYGAKTGPKITPKGLY